MADARYGRLFTEDDVVRLINAMTYEAPDEALNLGVVIEQAERDAERPLTFPADEPLFLLRASDPAAPEAIDEYELAASRAVPAAAEFRAWQQANPDRVKVPDDG